MNTNSPGSPTRAGEASGRKAGCRQRQGKPPGPSGTVRHPAGGSGQSDTEADTPGTRSRPGPAPGEARDHLTGALRAARDLAVRQGLAAMAASGSSDLAGGSTYYAGKNSQGQKLLFTVDHTASGPKFDPIFINQIARCPATGDGPR